MAINPPSKIKIAIAMSGGVDSTIAALLLKQFGANVTGITMNIYQGKRFYDTVGCFGANALTNITAAQKAAEIIGIPHQVINLSADFKKYILDYYKNERLAGRTPNPCVICNQKIKFGFLMKNLFLIKKFDFFATGHYSRITYDKVKKRYMLLRGVDFDKDQSYFLYRLNQTQLKKIIFPLGKFTKEEVKKIAQQNSLEEFANKKESQNFIKEQELKKLLPNNQKGEIIDTNGRVIGYHNGYYNFTIGQRQGLRIGGLDRPYYVVRIDIRRNKVIVGKKKEVFKKEFKIKNTHWIMFEKLIKPLRLKVRLRSNGDFFSCQVLPDKHNTLIILDEPQFAITSGQSAVFYDGDTVLGGGIII